MSSRIGRGLSQTNRHSGHWEKLKVPGTPKRRSCKPPYSGAPTAPHRKQLDTDSIRSAVTCYSRSWSRCPRRLPSPPRSRRRRGFLSSSILVVNFSYVDPCGRPTKCRPCQMRRPPLLEALGPTLDGDRRDSRRKRPGGARPLLPPEDCSQLESLCVKDRGLSYRIPERH